MVIGLPRGLILAIDNPVRQTFVIEMVGPDRVVNAVSLNSVLIHSARMVGPAIAGVLIVAVGGVPPFALNALTFVVMFAALWGMNPAELRSRPPCRTQRRAESGSRSVTSCARPSSRSHSA